KDAPSRRFLHRDSRWRWLRRLGIGVIREPSVWHGKWNTAYAAVRLDRAWPAGEPRGFLPLGYPAGWPRARWVKWCWSWVVGAWHRGWFGDDACQRVIAGRALRGDSCAWFGCGRGVWANRVGWWRGAGSWGSAYVGECGSARCRVRFGGREGLRDRWVFG